MSSQAVGVVGAGTMGAGIAQISVLGGMETLLHDPDPRALQQGINKATSAIEKGVERGRWSAEQAVAALARLGAAPALDAFAGRDLIVEAAPEDLELKRELFAGLRAATGERSVLATNTSSLSVTAVAEGIEHPELVVGMHFFNPPAAMKLVEIVAGERSGGPALELTDRDRRGDGPDADSGARLGRLRRQSLRPPVHAGVAADAGRGARRP